MQVKNRQSETRNLHNDFMDEPMTLSGLQHLISAIPLDETPDPVAVLPSLRWIDQALAIDA